MGRFYTREAQPNPRMEPTATECDDLRHIQIKIDFLIQTSAGVTLERFLDDATLQRALVRSIEVIGEAAKQVPDTFRSQHPHVAWR